MQAAVACLQTDVDSIGGWQLFVRHGLAHSCPRLSRALLERSVENTIMASRDEENRHGMS